MSNAMMGKARSGAVICFASLSPRRAGQRQPGSPSLVSSSTSAPFPAGGIPRKTSPCHLSALLNPLKVSTKGMSTTYGY